MELSHGQQWKVLPLRLGSWNPWRTLIRMGSVDSLLSCSRIELRALGKISEGEELTVSYIDFLHLSEERRQQLRKQYYFDCSCEHCQKGLKDDLFQAVKEDPKVHTTLLQGPRLPSRELGKGGASILEEKAWDGAQSRAGRAQLRQGGGSLKKPVFSGKGDQWPDCTVIMNTGQDDPYKRAGTQAPSRVQLPTLPLCRLSNMENFRDRSSIGKGI